MNDRNQLMNITVLLAGRPYPLKIKAEDEPVIRKIVKEINDKVNSFQLKYTTKDKQDCLSMVALTLAIDLAKTKSSSPDVPAAAPSDNSAILNQLSALDTLLSSALRNS